MVLQTENECQKNSRWKYTNENISSVIVAYEVNIFQLSVKCRWNVFVCENIGDYGIYSKYFSTLDKIPMEWFRL
jgi:hypothetical protein